MSRRTVEREIADGRLAVVGIRGARRIDEAARADAGLPHVRFHDLRHTAARWLAQSGANLAIIRDLLGHANLAVTSRYTHLMTGDLKRASEDVARQRGKNGAKVPETPHG